MSRFRALSWLILVVGLFAAAGWTAAANAQQTDPGDWPLQGQNAQQTGKARLSDGCTTGTPKWTAGSSKLRGVTIGPVGPNKTKAIICIQGGYPTAVALDGSLLWQQRLPNIVESEVAAIAPDGTVYCGAAYSGALYAINPHRSGAYVDSNRNLVNGIAWSYYVGGWEDTSPTIDKDGSILVGVEFSGDLFRLNPDGTMRWMVATGGTRDYSVGTAPSIGPDGTVYVGSESKALVAVTPDGKIKWRSSAGAHVHGGPAVAPDGTVYFADSAGTLYAANAATGKRKWAVPITQGKSIDAFTYGSPSVDPITKTVYCGGQESLYAYGFDGRLKWRRAEAGRTWSQPAIGASGATVFSHSHWLGKLVAFNSGGTKMWEADIGDSYEWDNPVIADDGTVYVGGSGVHAFQDGVIPRSTIYWLQFSPDPALLLPGDAVTLIAKDVCQGDVSRGAALIDHVDFYEDAPLLGEILLGTDSNGADGWSLTMPDGFSADWHDFHAVARDAQGNAISNVVSNYLDLTP